MIGERERLRLQYAAKLEAERDQLRAERDALALAAEGLAEALREGEALISGDATGVEWKRGCRAFTGRARTALAAYDAARERQP